jgi:hypothetical protein
METGNTANLADPYVIDSLAPGHKVSDLPILRAIRAFRRAVLEQGDGSNESVQEYAVGLLDVVHFSMTGMKITAKEIQKVSVEMTWTVRGGDELLIEIVDVDGTSFNYRIDSDMYLSKHHRQMGRIKEARSHVSVCQNELETTKASMIRARLLLAEAQKHLKSLEDLHVE